MGIAHEIAFNHQSTVSRNHEFASQIAIEGRISPSRSDFPQLRGDARALSGARVARSLAAQEYCCRKVSMIGDSVIDRWKNRIRLQAGRMRLADRHSQVLNLERTERPLWSLGEIRGKQLMSNAAEVIDIHKYYDLGGHIVKALQGVSLQVPEGDYIAIMGSSGSGKSTLLNLLGALDRPTKGEYIIGGKAVSQLNDNELSGIRNRMIGFIFQSYNLVPQYTVLENIEVPLHYRVGTPALSSKDRTWCRELCEMVGLSDRMTHRPFQLSGGQQQRVAIARALVGDPKIILADEPTGNLDSATEAEIMELLSNLNKEGRTIIMVTHEADVARRAKRQIYMKDGLIAGTGVFPGA